MVLVNGYMEVVCAAAWTYEGTVCVGEWIYGGIVCEGEWTYRGNVVLVNGHMELMWCW